ncbi:MAG TPA: gamma-glutamyl-gamma-aminobutyrate hydrolase family protein [Selenomonadales bacterium]|nr:gamma-glutamyl-gamma-aminobutyrate hydrolase family protein [Selenomonadales bacterium]
MQRPLIGITANIQIASEGLFAGNERAFVGMDYVRAVLAAGGTPVVLPAVEDPAAVRSQVSQVDGVLLSGGYDLDPQYYGEEPEPELGPVITERDEYELEVMKLVRELNKPALGICRGIQVMNVACGGTLYQDIAEIDGIIKHYQDSKKFVPGHTAEIVPGTKIHAILGETALKVNSFHHQAVKDIAPGFVISARAKDGLIEAIEASEAHLLGVQWHPEMMFAQYPVMLNVFRWLIDTARH